MLLRQVVLVVLAPVLVSFRLWPLSIAGRPYSLRATGVLNACDGPKPRKPVLNRNKRKIINFLMFKSLSEATIIIPMKRIINILCIKT